MGVVAQPASKRCGDYKSGDVAWAKVVDRPWWPCILFDSWDEMAAWDLPTEIAEKPTVTARQVICCFLENYNLQIFDKENGAIREWDDLERDRKNSSSTTGPLARRRRRAISDAEVLVKLARGEIEDYEDDFAATPEVNKRASSSSSGGGGSSKRPPPPFRESETRHHENSKRARSATSLGSVEKHSKPSSWLDCLRLLIRMRPANGIEIKEVVERSIELASDRAPSDVVARLRDCISPPVYHDDDAGLCRIKALKLLEDYGDGTLVLPESSRKYLEELERAGGDDGLVEKYGLRHPRASSSKTTTTTTRNKSVARLDVDHKTSNLSLKKLVKSKAIVPGEVVLEQPDGNVTATLRKDGLIAWNGDTYDDVDAFVAAAREAHGLRAPRAAQAKKSWDRIIHASTGKPLSEFLPSQKVVGPAPTPAPPPTSAKKGEASATASSSGKASKSQSSKRKRPPRPSLKADSEQHRRNAESKVATTSVAESGGSEEDQATADAATETPLSDYWKYDKVSSSQAAANVWDDGFFTDASDEDETANEPGVDEEDQSFLVDAGKAQQQQRTSSRQTSLRVRHIVDGLASNRLDPHALVGCEPYGGDVGGEIAGILSDRNHHRGESSSTQPFSLTVHPDVAFLCDLHAHLAEAEIIGLLGGRWDAGRRFMHVQAPFPCRAIPRDDDGATDVEMDPASELQVRDIIKNHDMDVVGWYHSHPKFAAEPSVTDIDNQRVYQQLFHDSESGLAPFIGLIVGTYDNASPSPSSVFRYFHVAPPPDSHQKQDGHRTPAIEEEEVKEVAHDAAGKSAEDEGITSAANEDVKPLEDEGVGIVTDGDVATSDSASGNGDVSMVLPCPPEDEDSTPVPPAPRKGHVEINPSSAIVREGEEGSTAYNDPSVPAQEPRQARTSRRVSRREEASSNRRAASTPLIPMALKAKVRSYRRRLDESAREERRAAGPPEPPFSRDLPAGMPFGFVSKLCGFGCVCCPPKGSNDEATAAEGPQTPSDAELPQATVAAADTPSPLEAPSLGANQPETALNKSREETVESVCKSVKERIEQASVSSEPAVDADAAWSKLEERYGQTKLSCVAHTVRQLGKYYGQNEHRVELSNHWRKDLSKWDKLLRSLTMWTIKMAVDPDKRVDFLSDIFIYMHACWRSKPKKKRPQPSRSRR